MTKRNLVWLAIILAVGVVVAVASGILWGLAAAAAVLVVSEVIERIMRQRRRRAKAMS